MIVGVIISSIVSGLFTWMVSQYFYKKQIKQQKKETEEMKKLVIEIHDNIKEGSMINARMFNDLLDKSSLSDEDDEFKMLKIEESGKYIDDTVDPKTYDKYFGVNPEKCKNCDNNRYDLIYKEVPYIECTTCKSSFIYKDLQKQKYIERYKNNNK